MALASKVRKSSVAICLCLTGLALILACGDGPKKDVVIGAPAAAPERPKSHVWDGLQKAMQEIPGYGMYTYVLFGRRVERLREAYPELAERYEKILHAITISTPMPHETRPIEEQTNIFYIPCKEEVEGEGKFDLSNYNSALAMQYIDRLAGMMNNLDALRNRFTRRPGPFLISTQYPLGALREGDLTLLYADLSDSNPAAMPEIVAAYKSYVCEARTEAVNRFNPLRLTLLNWFLNLDDDIQIVKVAAAAWLPK